MSKEILVSEQVTITENDNNMNIKFIKTLNGPGVGNKESSISMEKYMKDASPEKEAIADYMYELIKSGECMAKCTHDDDGCLDGRCTSKIAVPDGDKFEVVNVEDNKDNERAKISGGGYITALSMLQALGENGASPEADIAYIYDEFAKQGIHCGAHTGGHGSEQLGKTDCGANDRYDEIIANGILYREVVSQTTDGLLGFSTDSYSQELLDLGFDGWVQTIDGADYLVDSNGVTRLDAVREGMLDAQEANPDDQKVSVIKNLKEDHKEIRLIATYEEGETFSQTKLRRQLMEQFPDVDTKELPQVFVLDMWRVQQLAQAVASMPPRGTEDARTDDDLKKRYARALHAGVAFQVATYATLTDGTLPVDILADRDNANVLRDDPAYATVAS